MAALRTYSELITFPTFEERYQYLRLNSSIGIDTFGFDRYLNQMFYRSVEWKKVRDFVITRDMGCDLGIEGREIYKNFIVHHMNPITPEELKNNPRIALNSEFLITTCTRTHNAIHFGDEELLMKEPTIRRPNDTCPWKH